MRIDWWTLGLQAINAIVLIWLLSRFLFKPVAAIIAERQAAAARISADAEALKAAAAKDRADAEAAEASIAAHRATELKAAAEAAAKERARLIAAAHAEADQLRAAAQAEIDKHRADETHRADARAATLALAIADRLLARLPDENRITPYLPALGDGIDSLAADVRAGLRDAPIARLPRQPSETELAALKTLLSDRLGVSTEPRIEVDPTLIAGVELEGPHAVVRNSLRADLDRIARELARDGG